MADALFFRPLPVVAGQDRLLHYAFGTPMRDGLIPHVLSYANLAEIRNGATTVVRIAGQASTSYGLALDGVAPRLALGTAITANYFDVLGVRVIAGRTFRPEEDWAPGGDPVRRHQRGWCSSTVTCTGPISRPASPLREGAPARVCP